MFIYICRKAVLFMGQSSFFRRIKKILSPKRAVFFMRKNRFFRCFYLKESTLTAEKSYF